MERPRRRGLPPFSQPSANREIGFDQQNTTPCPISPFPGLPKITVTAKASSYLAHNQTLTFRRPLKNTLLGLQRDQEIPKNPCCKMMQDDARRGAKHAGNNQARRSTGSTSESAVPAAFARIPADKNDPYAPLAPRPRCRSPVQKFSSWHAPQPLGASFSLWHAMQEAMLCSTSLVITSRSRTGPWHVSHVALAFVCTRWLK